MIFVTTNGTRAIADAAPADTVLLGTLRNAGAVARYLEASGTDSIYLVCAGAGGRFNVEDFLGAATVLSRMDVDGYRLNDGALLALDFAERHEENVYETLKRSRAGRWFVENDRMDAFDFVADIGASGLVPEVVGWKAPTRQRARKVRRRRRVGSEPGREDMSETIEIREGEDFDLEATERYLRAHVEDVPEGELEVSQFPSGASNLTYLLKVGDWEGVLRRPPLGPVPPKAHDMGRESGILARLNAVYPLAPKPYFFCEDESVIGAPFYVMERRTGIVLDDSFPDGVEHDEELCRGISRTVVDTLVELHAVDVEEGGAGGPRQARWFPAAPDGRLDLALRKGQDRRDRRGRPPHGLAGPRHPREPTPGRHPQRLQAQ